jgi:hypothetical protein
MSLPRPIDHLACFETCVSRRLDTDCKHHPGPRRDVVAQIHYHSELVPAQSAGSILEGWKCTYVEADLEWDCTERTKDLKTVRTIGDVEQRLVSLRSIEKHQKIDSIVLLSQHSVVVGNPAHS